jgi:proteasome lid subunit RPN8/RPN11
MELVRIRSAAWDAMLAHARTAAPAECCGLLIGRDGLVEDCAPARNVHASATRFLIDPADHFAAIRRARAGGRRVIGAYHSHPHSAAVPSPTDLAEANDPELLYVIVSLAGGEDVRGYKLEAGGFVSVSLRREAPSPRRESRRGR